MKFSALITGGILAATASASFAQSLDPDRVEIFRSILAANECVLSEAVAANLLPNFDFDKDEARAIVGALVASGDVRLDGNTLHLIDGSCETEDPVAALLGQRDVQRFIGIMAENGCEMTEDEGEVIFTAQGISKDQVGAVIAPMVENGMASFDSSRGLLMVSSAYCSPVSTMVEATPPPTVTVEMVENDGSPEGIFLSVLAQNGCSILEETAQSAFPAAGLRMDQAYMIVDAMVARGEASLSADNTLITVNAAICVASATTPAPTPPPPVSPTPVEASDGSEDGPRAAILAMLSGNNCEISQANAAEVIAEAGLEFGPTMQMLSQMMADGTATTPDGGQTLQIGQEFCQPMAAAAPVTPREAFIYLLNQNDCSVTASEFSALLPVDGLDAATAFAMISDLEAEGVITLPASRDVVTLSAENCW